MITAKNSALLSSFKAVSSQQAKVLIVGSMPGVASLEQCRYYAHPRNAFWPIMCSYFGTEVGVYEDNLKLLVSKNVALWDVLKQCIRPGSLDSNIDIKSVQCNDFARFLQQHENVAHILFNGKAAEKMFMRHVYPNLQHSHPHLQFKSLPSSSPAMAMLSLDAKKESWRQSLDQCFNTTGQKPNVQQSS